MKSLVVGNVSTGWTNQYKKIFCSDFGLFNHLQPRRNVIEVAGNSKYVAVPRQKEASDMCTLMVF